MTETTAEDVRRELAKEFEARAELAESATGLDQAAFVWRQAARLARGETVEVGR